MGLSLEWVIKTWDSHDFFYILLFNLSHVVGLLQCSACQSPRLAQLCCDITICVPCCGTLKMFSVAESKTGTTMPWRHIIPCRISVYLKYTSSILFCTFQKRSTFEVYLISTSTKKYKWSILSNNCGKYTSLILQLEKYTSSIRF